MTTDLDSALKRFETVEANLRRLEDVWKEMISLIPEGIVFVGGAPEGQRYRELLRGYKAILKGLPPIGAHTIKAVPWELDEIAQNRADALGIGEFHAQRLVDEGIEAPGLEVEEYRAALIDARRRLVRPRRR